MSLNGGKVKYLNSRLQKVNRYIFNDKRMYQISIFLRDCTFAATDSWFNPFG